MKIVNKKEFISRIIPFCLFISIIFIFFTILSIKGFISKSDNSFREVLFENFPEKRVSVKIPHTYKGNPTGIYSYGYSGDSISTPLKSDEIENLNKKITSNIEDNLEKSYIGNFYKLENVNLKEDELCLWFDVSLKNKFLKSDYITYKVPISILSRIKTAE